jgi:Icc-related predicted phosphoesterase
VHPEALVFTGDLADTGAADAYRSLREVVEPAAERMGAQVVWVMGNHDDRAAMRVELAGEPPSVEPTVVHSVVPMAGGATVGRHVDAEATARALAEAGLHIPGSRALSPT